MYFLHHALIPTLWLAWLAYWVISAMSAKPTERQESAASRWKHNAPMLIGAILLASPSWPLLSGRFIPQSSTQYWLAVALIVVGLGFASLARAALGRNWSGAMVTVKQDHELIRSGPYALVRHPIYTGLLLAILGTALAIGQWRGLVAFACIAISVAQRVLTEERFMTEQFGDSYRRYKAEVAALVPFLL